MRRVSLVAFVSALLIGCSSSTAPARIDGPWFEVFNVGGFSTDMNLRTDGSVVSGSGTWCGEVLPCGSLTVRGTAIGNLVHLELVFSNGTTQVFDGRVVDDLSLVGKAKWSTGVPESFDVTFMRVPVVEA